MILQAFLKEFPKEITVRHIKRSEASSRANTVKVSRVFQCVQSLSPPHSQIYELLQTKVSELEDDIKQDIIDQIKNLIRELTPRYSPGNQFQKVVGIEKINFHKDDKITIEKSEFSPQIGIVYLLYIWFPEDESCEALMDQYSNMLERNPDWEGKAKIVGIALSFLEEDIFNQFKGKRWQSIENFRLIYPWNNHDPIKFLEQYNVPFLLLLNKWGKIVYIGHPSNTNFEEKIISEINAEQDISIVEQEEIINNDQSNQILSKEEYKQLKSKIISLQTALKEISFEGIVNVCLEKINIWKNDGTKSVLNRSKLILSYDINVSEEEKINEFLVYHWNIIPDNLRHVNEAKIRDPIKKQKEIKTKFQEAFAALGVTISYPDQDTHKFIYDKNRQKFESQTKRGFCTEADNLTHELFKQGMENLKNYLAQFQELTWEAPDQIVIRTIVSGLKQHIFPGVGKKFETIKNYQKWKTNEYTKIKHKPGQVLLIVYWAQGSQRCVIEIEKITKLVKQNAEIWGNDVRVVLLSINLSKNATDFMNTHQVSQDVIEFYFPMEEDQPDIKKYSVRQYPQIIIVDKFGTIRHIGEIKKIGKLLTSLLSEQVSWVKIANLHIQLNQIQQIMSSNLFAQLDPQRILEFQLLLVSKPLDNVAIIQNSELSYFARDTQKQELKPVFDQLFQMIPKNQWTITKVIQKTVSIPYPGKECAVCNKDILNQPQQYYSPFKSEHICAECAESDDKEKKGNQRYKYLDTLVFINGPLSDLSVLNNIDDHKIGNNRKLLDGQEGSQLHPICCNGCGEDEEGPRYISINTRPGKYQNNDGYIDYCHKCFLQLKNKTSEKAKEIIAKDAEEGMILDSLFTRVLFNYGDYRDF